MILFDLMAACRYKIVLKKFSRQFRQLDFDTKVIDSCISLLANDIYSRYSEKFRKIEGDRHCVSYVASALYTVGGHTPCIINLAESMSTLDIKQSLFLSRLKCTEVGALSVIQKLRLVVDFVAGVDDSCICVVRNVIALYNQIVDSAPRNLIIFIHQNDILSAMVLYLLRQNTDIKLIFWNHASHFPNVGMHFAHCILEGTPTTRRITEEYRGLKNCKLIGLQSKAADDIYYFSSECKRKKRLEFCVADDEWLTVSGGLSDKFFAKNNQSEYFCMVLSLLRKESKLKHIVMSEMNQAQLSVIEDIFAEYPEARSRLMLMPRSADFAIVFQSADLYIDSFPIASAMTQIDCMANKVPTVVFVNRQEPEHSFHEYFSEDYPYMYDNVSDMELGVIYLLKNKTAKERAVDMNYQYWIKNYERNAVLQKYLDIFASLDYES